MSGFYPEFEDSREVQLGSLAAIGFLLQIRDLLGDIDRFERSVRFKFSRSVWFKFFLETEKVQIQMFPGEKKPNLIWQLLLIKSGLLRVPNFRCGTGLRPIPHRKFDWQFSWFFWFLVLQNELRSLRKFFGFCRGGKPLLQILHLLRVEFCNSQEVQNYSRNPAVF